MASTKEIKSRINSVNETRKITNAMYLIASSKLRKARSAFLKNEPYFSALKNEIVRLFIELDDVDSIYFKKPDEGQIKGKKAYLVITADRGLAGAYNQSVIKKAMSIIDPDEDNLFFVVGEYGRHYFATHHMAIEQSFQYTAQDPNLHRCREICECVLQGFHEGQFNQIFIIYTDYTRDPEDQVVATRLLPFDVTHFSEMENEDEELFEFHPSPAEVLEHIMPHYIFGFIYSALVDSFCSEQYARMTAMDSANTNAQNLMDELSVEYNHVRQSAITQEITEISAGSRRKHETPS